MKDFNFKYYNPRNLLTDLSLANLSEKILTKRNSFILSVLSIFLLFIGVFYLAYLSSPNNFPIGVVVGIEKGENLEDISKYLEGRGVVKSAFLFEWIVRIFQDETGVLSGDYFFEERKNLFSVFSIVTKGDFGLSPIRVTLYEGTSTNEMADILEKKYSEFDTKEFKRLVEEQNKEGYLFPDTYFFLPNIKAEDVIQRMEDNFYKKILEVQERLDASEYTLHEILTMASLLEEEARTLKVRKIISGILWNRMDIGMALQVDAVFPYIIGKNTYEVSLEDLKNDSPYNTYMHAGLPPGPITNPGLTSIIAALEPIESDYFYYLSDRHGNTYYAIDFEGHKENRRLYMD